MVESEKNEASQGVGNKKVPRKKMGMEESIKKEERERDGKQVNKHGENIS